MRAFAIAAPLLEQIYAHAREAFPAECCGYVRGNGPEVGDVVRCRNAEVSAPERGFAIDGRELFDFARSFESDRPARVVYHSHPNGRAYFSDTDRRMAIDAAYPVQHLVVGITAERVVEVAQFALAGEDVLELARWEP
ncbi:MAG: Mov34/MPN/PAD-1 family protein [Myxococcota bacterium]|nr:Mov34/MPN/PAD-1 family protein [Myxococcota bacterium]